jgi:hypothetical protein
MHMKAKNPDGRPPPIISILLMASDLGYRDLIYAWITGGFGPWFKPVLEETLVGYKALLPPAEHHLKNFERVASEVLPSKRQQVGGRDAGEDSTIAWAIAYGIRPNLHDNPGGAEVWVKFCWVGIVAFADEAGRLVPSWYT